MRRINRETTIEDLQANPKAYGLPTFQEFAKSRDKYMGRDDDAMVSITEGPKSFRKDLRKIIFKIHGVKIESEESVERILGDHGYGLVDIDLENRTSKLKRTINMIPQGAGKYDIEVDFLP